MMKILPLPSIIFSLLIFLGTFTQSVAQSQDWLFDLGLSYARPLSDFRSEGYNDGMGLNIGLYSPLFMQENGLAGLRLGMRSDFDFAGRSKGNLIAINPETGEMDEMHLSNSSINLLGVMRLESTPNIPVQLYMEGLVGTRRGVTSEVFDNHMDFGDDNECIESPLALKTWDLTYGAAAGTLIRVNEDVRLNFRVSYLTSRPVDFADLSTAAQVEDNLYTFQQRSAPATQMRIQAGISINLDAQCAPSRSSLEH